MSEMERLQKATNEAIKNLRSETHSLGLPFMINSSLLESHQCFLEYPDGLIKIAELNASRTYFEIVFEFSKKESKDFKKKLGLI